MDNEWKIALNAAVDTLKKVTPDESVIGEPFWAIMELRNGDNTGRVWGRSQGKNGIIPLFLSKGDAVAVARRIPQNDTNWAVRGITRQHLTFLLLNAPADALFGIVREVASNGQFATIPMTREEIDQYLNAQDS